MTNRSIWRQIISGFRDVMWGLVVLAAILLVLEIGGFFFDFISPSLSGPSRLQKGARALSEQAMMHYANCIKSGEDISGIVQDFSTRYDLYALGKVRVSVSSEWTTNAFGRINMIRHIQKFGGTSGTGEVIVISEKVNYRKERFFPDRTVAFCFESGTVMRVSERTWGKLLLCDEMKLYYDSRKKCWEGVEDE